MRAFTTTLKRPKRARQLAERAVPLKRARARVSRLFFVLIMVLISVFTSACEPTTQPPSISSQPTLLKSATPSDLSPLSQPHAPSGLTQLEVWSLVLARRVRAQLPHEVNTRFALDEPHVWAWAELSARGGPRSMLLRWRKGGELRAEHQVSLKGEGRQRVWARLLVNPQDEGVWTLSLEDTQGRRYQRAHFELYAPSVDGSPESSHNTHLSTIPAEELTSLRISEDQTTPHTTHAVAASSSPQEPSSTAPPQHRSPKHKSPKRTQPLTPSRAQGENQRSTHTHQREEQEAHNTQAQHSEVRRLLVATSVKHRRPVGVSVRFSAEHERLWGYLEVRHIGSPALLKMEWWREGELRSKLKVRVGESLRWRTWSWQRLRPHRDAGAWTLKVLSSEGDLLAETHFEVLDEKVSPP